MTALTRSAARPSRTAILSSIWMVVLLTIGAIISAVAVIVFEAPFNIAPGGVSGLAIIINSYTQWPIGLMVLIGNIPIQIIAFRMLGGWRVVAGTIYTVVVYSVLIDVLTPYFPAEGVSRDIFLNSVFGGIVGGIGAGLVFRAGGTLGGTSTLGRILQERYGIPLSSSTLYTDSIVIVLAGVAFGWENAMYAIVMLFIAGVTADYVLEGPSVIRTAVIITDRPREIADAVLAGMGRGVTGWDARGMYTEQAHTVLYVTIGRGQVNTLRRIAIGADPAAFLVFGHGHNAYGQGFRAIRGERPPQG
ncbi:MAG TPA: YitT family protein [Candidatus Limnocylindrales bacterium]|nr:YitT family protein [Candidatus Limnocylindrales bacterium]